MKKIIAILIILSVLSLQVKARPQIGTGELITILSGLCALLLIYIISSFVLTLIRHFLTDRLKKAMIEKGSSQEVIARLLPADKSQKDLALKWCCLLSAAGLGLLVVYFFPPLGLHSVIIVTFSLAAGFLVYYLLLRRTGT